MTTSKVASCAPRPNGIAPPSTSPCHPEPAKDPAHQPETLDPSSFLLRMTKTLLIAHRPRRRELVDSAGELVGRGIDADPAGAGEAEGAAVLFHQLHLVAARR